MDWNLKTPSWDLAEFEQETTNPNISSVGGSSSFGGQGIKGDFSVDLKLGHVPKFCSEAADNNNNIQVPRFPKMEFLPPGSSKRARAASNGIQTPTCKVDGCQTDLRNCREYHRRHKVCEVHSKTPEVTIDGHKQRFCQQCSRFHSLEEFDEGKRSCRKRLDGHNRRRRKPQPEPLSCSGTFLSNYQGTRMIPFSSPEVHPTTALASPIWTGVLSKSKQNPYPGSSSSSSISYREGKQSSFLHGPTLALHNETLASSETGGGHSHEVFCEGDLSTQVLNSSRALSLLSTSSSSLQTSDISLSQMVPQTSISTAHPLGPSPHNNSLETIDSLLVPNASDTNVHYQGMFRLGRESSSENEASQAHPFYWE